MLNKSDTFQINVIIEKVNFEFQTKDIIAGFSDQVAIRPAYDKHGNTTDRVKMGSGDYIIVPPSNWDISEILKAYIQTRLEKTLLQE